MNNSRIVDDKIRNKNRNTVLVSCFVVKAVKEMMHVDNVPNVSAVIKMMCDSSFSLIGIPLFWKIDTTIVHLQPFASFNALS